MDGKPGGASARAFGNESLIASGSPRAADEPARAAKDALRAGVRAARADEPESVRRARDAARLTHLLALATEHDTVACYLSLDPEPDTLAFVETLHGRGVRVLVPVLQGHRTPAWGWYSGAGSLVAGLWGIPEPSTGTLGSDALGAASLVVTSALLATPEGVRLGTGGGWYDRALTARRRDALVASVLNAREVVPALPTEAWDVRVGALVTEEGVHRV